MCPRDPPLALWRSCLIPNPKRNKNGTPSVLMLPCHPDDLRKSTLNKKPLKILMTEEEREWLAAMTPEWGVSGLQFAGQRELPEAVNARAIIRNAMHRAPAWMIGMPPELCGVLPVSPPSGEFNAEAFTPALDYYAAAIEKYEDALETRMKREKDKAVALTKVPLTYSLADFLIKRPAHPLTASAEGHQDAEPWSKDVSRSALSQPQQLPCG
jgi:hypothetical protein